MNHRKAKARAAALILRCEERLASAVERCFVHAAARVFHADANILAWLEPCYFIGIDPFGTSRNDQIDPMTGSANWGLRAVQDDPDSKQWGGKDVFDVYSQSTGTAMDGTKYSDW